MHFAGPCLAVLIVGAGACLRAEPSAFGDSPFLPPGSATGNRAQSASDPYELTGSSTTSRGTQVCILDAQAKQSHWIEIGGAYGDIRVVSYDPASDQAVINVHGSRMSLGMRKAVVSNQPNLLATPIAPFIAASIVPRNVPPPVQPQSAETAKKEREARMLVSDLLDIGIQQRKAYEEALKQKAQQPAKPN